MTAAAAQPTERQREIAQVAARLFREKGYRVASIRDVADALGVRSASLYYHFGDKDEILFTIVHGLMADFVAEVTPVLEREDDPVAAIAAGVEAHLRFDLARLDDVLVSARERRSLPPERQRPVNRLRARHRRAVAAAIEAGVARGDFDVDDAPVAANALLDLLSGVKEWFEPTSRRSVDLLVARYQRLALGLLRATRAQPDVGS